MPLVELLQWLGSQIRTGVLEVDHGQIRRRVVLRGGRIVACSSNDPSNRLGQFLISRGKIRSQTLEFALERQQASGGALGQILVEIGVMTRAEVDQQLVAKAEEAILGMFDWDDAEFRFRSVAPLDPHPMEVDLSTRELVLRGVERQDDLRKIREVFPSSGVVLARTDRPVRPELLDSDTLHVLDRLDGERTIGELLLGSRSSEFALLTRTHALYADGLVKIVGALPPDPQAPTLLDAGLIPDAPVEASPGAPDQELTTLHEDEVAAVLDRAIPTGPPEQAAAVPRAAGAEEATCSDEAFLEAVEACDRLG